MAENMNNESAALIKSALAKIAGKQTRIETFDRYYRGDHPFNYSSEKFTTQFANRLKQFRDNLCRTVVKAPADRLEVVGFSDDADAGVYETSWAAWQYSQLTRLAKRVHRDAFRTGDAFVIAWQDETGKGRIYPQDPRNCTVFYNVETGFVDSGAKVWRGADNYVYLTLYFRDRVEKYITRNPQGSGNVPTTAAAFVKREVAGESWPLPNAIGECAMFHFGLEDSILTDVIPLNDALNKSIADMLVSSESNSLRQRWTSGISYEINPETGKQIIPFEAAAQWFASNDPNAKFGEFRDVDLKNFLDVVNDFRSEIANVAGIPQYYFRLEGGNLPSGEALRKAESRFTSIVKDAQLDFGDTWARAMRFVLRINGENEAAAAIETRWAPADPMSSNELVDLAIKKKQVGVSDSVNLSEIGYSTKEIETMRNENAEKDARAADAFNKTFNAGPQIN